MCHVAELAERYKRLLVLVPRDHYKTSIFTIAYPAWRGMRNPSDRGLICCNTMTNAMRMGSKIRSTFEKKPLVRSLYPELKPELSKRWNNEELCLPREVDNPEATWTFAGWSTRVTSGHYDYALYDDIVDEETYESAELMAKLIDRFEQREGLMNPPIQDRPIIVVMNHWSQIDIACHILEKHPEYHVYYRQAIEGGKPIFPEMYSLDWLLRKQEVNPYNFATQWMNNPSDPSITENKREWLQYYKRGNDSVIIQDEFGEEEEIAFGKMNIYCAVDPRHTLSHTAAEKMTSRNALVVAGIDPKGRRFLLEEYTDRQGPEVLVRKMLEVWKRWYPHGIIQIGVEGYGFQAALAPLSLEIWKNENNIPRIEALQRDTTKSKETRCRGGLRFFAEGKGFIHKSMVYFKEEYIPFPTGRTKDVVDAWTWCMHMMHAPMDDEHHADEEARDQEYLNSLRTMARI